MFLGVDDGDDDEDGLGLEDLTWASGKRLIACLNCIVMGLGMEG